MNSLNDYIKNISLKELLILLILLFIIQSLVNTLNIIHIDSLWIYIIIVFYFIYKMKNHFKLVKNDLRDVFKLNNFKTILFIVVLNIFISYGFLYLADYFLGVYPQLSIFAGSITLTGLFAVIIISPLCEELIFRGVFLNRFNLILPVVFSVLITSLIFASLHTYGSIISAFIFSLSMCILYLKSENIFLSIFAHFLNNLIAEVIVILDAGEILFKNHLAFSFISICAVSSFIILLVWLVKELNIIKK